MAVDPFDAVRRAWDRITGARAKSSPIVPLAGDLLVTDEGRLYGGDGATAIKDLSPAARLSDLAPYALTADANGRNGFVFPQAVPAATWAVDHHFGRRPSATLYNAAGQRMLADEFADEHTYRAYFPGPVIGSVVLL